MECNYSRMPQSQLIPVIERDPCGQTQESAYKLSVEYEQDT